MDLPKTAHGIEKKHAHGGLGESSEYREMDCCRDKIRSVPLFDEIGQDNHKDNIRLARLCALSSASLTVWRLHGNTACVRCVCMHERTSLYDFACEHVQVGVDAVVYSSRMY